MLISDIYFDILPPAGDMMRVNLKDFDPKEHSVDYIFDVTVKNRAGQELRLRVSNTFPDRFIVETVHGILVLHPTGGMNTLGVEIRK